MESQHTYISGPGGWGANFSDILESSVIGIIETHLVEVIVSLDHTCPYSLFDCCLAGQLEMAWWLVRIPQKKEKKKVQTMQQNPAAVDQWYHLMITVRLELFRKHLKGSATFVESV